MSADVYSILTAVRDRGRGTGVCVRLPNNRYVSVQ